MDPIRAVENFKNNFCYRERNPHCILTGKNLEEARSAYKGLSPQAQYYLLRDFDIHHNEAAAIAIGLRRRNFLSIHSSVRKLSALIEGLRFRLFKLPGPLWEKRRTVRLSLILLKQLWAEASKNMSLSQETMNLRRIRAQLIAIYGQTRKGSKGSSLFDSDDDLTFDHRDKTPLYHSMLADPQYNTTEKPADLMNTWSDINALVENTSRFKAFIARIPEGSRWRAYAPLGLHGSGLGGAPLYEVTKRRGKIVIIDRIYINPESASVGPRIKDIEVSYKKKIESALNSRLPERWVKVEVRFVDDPFRANTILNLTDTQLRAHMWRWTTDESGATMAHEVGHQLGWPDRYHEHKTEHYMPVKNDYTFRPGMHFLTSSNELMNKHYVPGSFARKHDVRFSIAAAFHWEGYLKAALNLCQRERYEEALELERIARRAARVMGVTAQRTIDDYFKLNSYWTMMKGQWKKLKPLHRKGRILHQQLIAAKSKNFDRFLAIATKLEQVAQKMLEIHPRSKRARFFLMEAAYRPPYLDAPGRLQNFLLLSNSLSTDFNRYLGLAGEDKHRLLRSLIMTHLNRKMGGDFVIHDITLNVPQSVRYDGPHWLNAELTVYDTKAKRRWKANIKLTPGEISTILRQKRTVRLFGDEKERSFHIGYRIKGKLMKLRPRVFETKPTFRFGISTGLLAHSSLGPGIMKLEAHAGVKLSLYNHWARPISSYIYLNLATDDTFKRLQASASNDFLFTLWGKNSGLVLGLGVGYAYDWNTHRGGAFGSMKGGVNFDDYAVGLSFIPYLQNVDKRRGFDYDLAVVFQKHF